MEKPNILEGAAEHTKVTLVHSEKIYMSKQGQIKYYDTYKAK